MEAINGIPIVSHFEIQQMRDEDAKTPNPYAIIAQEGGQEKLLSSEADITIYGGNRGGGKSFGILLETLNDVNNKGFKALIMRKEKNDLSDLIETSYNIYSNFGSYNKSKDDMTWNFNSGASLKFAYYADSYEDFKQRFQGKQFSYIAIDEVTHIEYLKFKYIITDNRNASFIRNRIIASCNPDPDSWVAPFIGWWIDEDGYPIPERDGRVRYCFMDGDNVGTVVWGDTRAEVYEQCRSTIDRYWREEYAEYGRPEELFIKSVTFIQGKLSDNKQLMRSDPTYLASLANQTEEQRARDLDGNWKFKEVGDEMIKLIHMEKFFSAPAIVTSGKPYASCDIAMEGGDNLVLVLWRGNMEHIQDIFVCQHNSRDTVEVVSAKLQEWGVPQENFTYDLNGLGQMFKGFFPRAVPFVNNAGVDRKMKYVYANLKSQAAYIFAQKVINGEVSINHNLLHRRFSGKGYSNLPLEQILLKERKVIRQDQSNTDHGFALPKKVVMKKLIGHSPDFIEAIFMAMIFHINKKKRTIRGLGLL